MRVHFTILELTDSDWSRNSDSRSCEEQHSQYQILLPRGTAYAASSCALTRWKTCSLLISANRPFSSLTLPTILSILFLSSLSILLLSPIAMSNHNFTPPFAASLPLNQPCNETAAGPEGVKQSLCRPLSAALKVNFEGFSEEVEV